MKPSNVLFVFSDEHDPRYMGCSGHPFVKTPNLDRLAARGTRFTNAWTPCPVCVPARASLATGRWVHEIGYWDNAIAYDGRVPGWGKRLQEAGRAVESIGKLHYRNEADATGFDRQHEPMHILGGVGQLWGSVRDPMPEKAGRSALYDQVGAGLSNYNRYDQRITELAVGWLEDRARLPAGEPWLLFVGFVAPHMPLVVPQEYLDLYLGQNIPMPKLLPRDGYQRHPWVERMASHWDHDATLGSDARRRLAMACYFGLITYLDSQLGHVLAALERTGLAADTRVIYSTDHGDNLGSRGLWNKDVLYRESTAIPLLMAGPGIERSVSSTNVGLVDLYPTFLEATGVPLTRSSNSPLYLAPATSKPISRETRILPFRFSGTSPLTIRCAMPSTMAVLPTPGSPSRMGLFFVRRARICSTRLISSSRPITGSIFPALARSFRFFE